jgi:hypothetical protein
LPSIEEATDRLEFHLIEAGTNLLTGAGGAARDPHLAMWILKREDQKRAGTPRRGAAVGRLPSIEEVTEKILRRVDAIERHRARQAAEDGAGGDGGAGPG